MAGTSLLAGLGATCLHRECIASLSADEMLFQIRAPRWRTFNANRAGLGVPFHGGGGQLSYHAGLTKNEGTSILSSCRHSRMASMAVQRDVATPALPRANREEDDIPRAATLAIGRSGQLEQDIQRGTLSPIRSTLRSPKSLLRIGGSKEPDDLQIAGHALAAEFALSEPARGACSLGLRLFAIPNRRATRCIASKELRDLAEYWPGDDKEDVM